VVTGGGQMIAFDTGGGLNRWTYSADGCTLDPAVVGSDWIATVSRCAGGLRRLVVHSTTVDKAPWVGTLTRLGSARARHGRPGRRAGRQHAVALLRSPRTRTASRSSPGRRRVGRPAGRLRHPAAVQDGDFLVVWTGRDAAGVDLRNRTVLWTAAATGPPTLTEDRQVLLAGPDGFTIRPRPPAGRSPRSRPAPPCPTAPCLSRFGSLIVRRRRRPAHRPTA
jgi:hypothetical protein